MIYSWFFIEKYVKLKNVIVVLSGFKKNLLPAVLDNLVCCRDLDLVINHFNQKDIAVSKVIIMIV